MGLRIKDSSGGKCYKCTNINISTNIFKVEKENQIDRQPCFLCYQSAIN